MTSQPPSVPPTTSASPRSYADFQIELYTAGVLLDRKPLVTTDANKLEEQARAKLPLQSYNYVAGGAGERATMDANRQAFRSWRVVPRMLRNMSQKSVAVELFGVRYDSPVLMAPVGVQTIFHEDREVGLAKACAEIGVPYIMSTASSSSIEEVAEASGDGHRWFQLYWPPSDTITQSLLSRAKASGFKVLVVTLDTWSLAWRPADLDEGYIPFMRGVGNQVGFTDPAFRAAFAAKHNGATPEEQVVLASREWVACACPGTNRTWEDLKLLRGWWDGPIVLKGIQHVEDARMAVKAGVDGIVVSNHGGRQLDGAVGSLEVLPEIVDAVGKDITVLFDSGIRTGVDVVKALSLGAKAVLVGRPAIYGFAVGGAEGAKQVLRGLLADFEQSLGLAGINGVEGCTREVLRRAEFGGELRSSN